MCLMNKWRLGGICDREATRQEVLGAYLSLPVSIKNRTIASTSIKIERMPLTLLVG
jgi:hypothetical protein